MRYALIKEEEEEEEALQKYNIYLFISDFTEDFKLNNKYQNFLSWGIL